MIFSKNNIEYRKMQKGYLFVNGIAINNTAFKIWSMCDEKNTKEEIIKAFYKKYNPQTTYDKNLINSDIDMCLKDLVEAELINVYR